jgi:hypothetical protein
MFRYKVTVVARVRPSPGGSAAGNGHSFNDGVNAGPTSGAFAEGGRGGNGGHGGNGGDGGAGKGHGGWDGARSSGGGGGWSGGDGGSGGVGGSGRPAGTRSGARGGGNAASQSSVSKTGNSANTNVTSANIQVNPDIRVRNESANVVASHNDNVDANVNGNDNHNRADADADARAANGNLNLNVGVNESANANAVGNTNTPSNSNSSTNTGSNTSTNNNGNANNNPPVPFANSRATCESYGGTFVVGPGDPIWTCTNLATLDDGPFSDRSDVLAAACTADGGSLVQFNNPPPQDAICHQP